MLSFPLYLIETSGKLFLQYEIPQRRVYPWPHETGRMKIAKERKRELTKEESARFREARDNCAASDCNCSAELFEHDVTEEITFVGNVLGIRES